MELELIEQKNETEDHRTEAVKRRPIIIQLLHGKLESETGMMEIPLENTSVLLHQKASRSTQTDPGTMWTDGRSSKTSQMPVIVRMPRNARDDANVASNATNGNAVNDATMSQFVDACEVPFSRMKKAAQRTKKEETVEQRTDDVSKENKLRSEQSKTTLSIRRTNSFTSFAIEKYRLKSTKEKPQTALARESRIYYNNSSFIRQRASSNSCSAPQMAAGKLDLEIAELDRQLERVRMECHGIVESDSEQGDPQKPRLVPRMGTRLCNNRLRYRNGFTVSKENGCTTKREEGTSGDPQNLHQSSEGENAAGDTSTSAYNTGDSSCSTPLAALDQSELERRLIESANRSNNSSFMSETFSLQNIEQNLVISTKNCAKLTSTVNELKDRDSSASRDHVTATANSAVRCCDHATVASNQNRCSRHVPNTATDDLNAVYVGIMYTNMANLDHTIMVQQRLFDQQLRLKGRSLQGATESAGQLQNPASSDKSCCTPLDEVTPANSEESPGRKLDDAMEWVVKRRSDGTRYIARRTATRHQPKKKLKEHPRNMLSSEEDETVNDVKMGRNWSREERRRHAQAARHRRLSKKLRLEETSDQCNIEDCSRVVQLQSSRRSPNRCRKRFDDSGPVLHLSSGHRDVLKRNRNPLLSVTTI